MRRPLGLALALALAGCATVQEDAAARGAMSVSYETGPCFGACPVYRVTVNSDGSGMFEGRRFTAVEGQRAFRISRQQFDALVAHLDPVRPAQGSVRYAGEACERVATDLPSAEVTWRMLGDGQQQLYFYYGCDMEKNRAIAERLDAVPRLLGIEDFLRPGE
ncbi:MAG TPA: DUF6438 domain-containing protein [Allosphingosinicella sp.]|jgi:hypothetical protein|nr:DUF6438 domain-containing protein [Allosphingosinicella sp.]